MDKLDKIFLKILNENLTQIVISGRKKNAKVQRGKEVRKIKIRPVLIKEQLLFQVEEFTEKQAFHHNFSKEETGAYIRDRMNDYKQLQAVGRGIKVDILSGKTGNLTIKSKIEEDLPHEGREGVKKQQSILSHNRAKDYILSPDKPVPFLVDLGVQTREGKVVKAKYDKFRQINRFLEFIRDVLPQLPKGRRISVLDFGCGKSYLTFAMYYYLKIMNGLDVEIIGLDLKEEVIEKCNALKERYGYDDLQFLVGDIGQYEGRTEVDMVVTLHACDTATDYALAKAVKWNAKVILSVPCCQHELNRQISCQTLLPVLKHGLLRERMSAVLTDGIRAALLERAGYEVQVLEFIDMEHTPKNILLRCIKNTRIKPKKDENVEEMLTFLNAVPTLQKLLEE